MIISGRFNSKKVKTYPDADCGNDHVPDMANIQVKLQTLKFPSSQVQFDYSQLHKNNIIKEQYAVSVKINLKHCNRIEK